MKFSAWLLFAGLWTTIVYFPLAHMVWGGGILSHAGASVSTWIFATTDGRATVAPIDFAGGTVVHISAGTAAMVLALVVGKRAGFPGKLARPHSLPMVMLGAALLWFGWFGFNGGSAFAADGAASGVVAGLVAITPAAGALTPLTSIFLGAVGGVLACLGVSLKYKFGYDDSLDVVGRPGCHCLAYQDDHWLAN